MCSECSEKIKSLESLVQLQKEYLKQWHETALWLCKCTKPLPQQPQPAQPERTPRLVGAVEKICIWLKSWNEREKADMLLDALAAEKERQELVGEFIDSIRRNDKDCISTESFNRLKALDAFDKERGA